VHPPVLIFESRQMPQQIADQLTQTVTTWRLRLQELPHDLVRDKPSADRWSIAEVVGHLVDSANNNHQRFVRAQFCDGLEFPKYEQNQWVASAKYNKLGWENLVPLWYYYNVQIAHLIENMNPETLETPCTIYPYPSCTLSFLVTDYLDHLQHHLEIVEKRIEQENLSG